MSFNPTDGIWCDGVASWKTAWVRPGVHNHNANPPRLRSHVVNAALASNTEVVSSSRRALLFEAHGIFLETAAGSASRSGDARVAHLIAASRSYRARITANARELEEVGGYAHSGGWTRRVPPSAAPFLAGLTRRWPRPRRKSSRLHTRCGRRPRWPSCRVRATAGARACSSGCATTSSSQSTTLW